MKSVVGDAVDAEHHRLAVDYELLEPVLQGCLDNPRIAVVATSGDQAHPVAIAFQPEAIAIVFHFVQPARAVGDAGCLGRQAKFKTTAAHRQGGQGKKPPTEGCRVEDCESSQRHRKRVLVEPVSDDVYRTDRLNRC